MPTREDITQMRKQLFGMIAAVGAAAAIGLGAPPAFAAPTFTVAPGGPFTAGLNGGTAVPTTLQLQNLATGGILSCAVSNMAGTFNAGAGLTILGTINSLTAAGCTGLGGVVAGGTVTSNAAPGNLWSMTGTGYAAGVDGGQTTITITAPGTGIGATLNLIVAGVRCAATLGGTPAQPADAEALYDNTPGLLAVTGTANLVVLVTSCPGLAAGNIVVISTVPASTPGAPITNGYMIVPKQLITSP
jgi:hypothetical protein